MNAIPCSVCQEAGHPAQKCPTLVAPLQPGFQGGGGHGNHGDDEEERLKFTTKAFARCQINNHLLKFLQKCTKISV